MAGVLCVVMSRVWIGSGTFTLLCSPLCCPTLRCVCCHSIVGLVPRLCDGVVSLWNSGDGLCWVEGRGGLYATHVVLVVRLPCFVSPRSVFSSSFVVGVRGSARAALRARTLSPNTIVSSAYCFSSASLLPLSHSAFLLLSEWRWVCLPCITVLCWHDGYG